MSFAESISVEEIEANPYPIYKRLRDEHPVAFVPALNSWLVTRWEDVKKVGTSPDIFQAEDDNAPVVRHFGKPAIIHSDGDVHQELRKGIAPYYAPKQVKGYIDDLVRPIARECIEAFDISKPVDLVANYFEPISVFSLARSFGVYDVDIETLRQWFYGLSMGAINFSQDPERTRICEETVDDINKAFSPIFERLEKAPANNPLSHMLYHSMPEGKRRSREFVMPSILVTLLGGMQEPGHGAANTLVGLLENPDQFAKLRAGDFSIKDAVAEGLRWIAPIGTQGRSPIEDIELGGATIKAGEAVSAVIASANRDEDIFANADQFIIGREEKSQAAFGFGGHFCAGKWMALSQIEIALEMLFDEFREIELDSEQPHSFFGWEFRAPVNLFVHLKK